MKKGIRLFTLFLLMLMLRYTLLPHQFVSYASYENVLTDNVSHIHESNHSDIEYIFDIEHPDLYLNKQIVVAQHLLPIQIAPVRLTVSEPLAYSWGQVRIPPDRAPPDPRPVAIHISSTRLLI